MANENPSCTCETPPVCCETDAPSICLEINGNVNTLFPSGSSPSTWESNGVPWCTQCPETLSTFAQITCLSGQWRFIFQSSGCPDPGDDINFDIPFEAYCVDGEITGGGEYEGCAFTISTGPAFPNFCI